ncbi:lipopolysaccharide biosynthesis protein [Aggregatilinea lenta]|uniref:lipopolysaccharide biosynthesis protein n=1 Tax=Aggregatilinea lenta TaxID=913108 RepID=UPI000E5B582F|nr:oligosaccharide flippase family protein [Aggregatilinea lenta]
MAVSPEFPSPDLPAGSALSDLTGLLGRSGTYALSDIFKQAINFLLLPLYTAYLSKADYGALSIALAASAVLEVIYGLGLRGAIGRLYFDQKGEGQVRAFLGTLTTFLTSYGVLLSALLMLVGPALWPLLGLDESVRFSPYIVLVLLAVPLNNLGLALVLPLYYTRGQALRYAAYSLFSFAAVTGATVLLVVGLGQGAVGALWGRLVAAVVVLAPTIYILARNVRFTFRWSLFSPALMFSLPLVPHLISTWALNFSDRIVLGNFVSLDDVGVYTVGYQFGLLVSIVIAGINNAWTPWYFRANTEGRREHIPAFVTYFVIVAAALALGAALLARDAVRIMTAPAYHDAWVIVPLVALGYFLNAIALRFMDVLMLHKRTSVVPLTTIAAGLANIGFNIAVIPHVGLIGAAYGTVFGYAVRLALTAYYAARTGPLPFEWGRVLRVSVLALVVAPGLLLRVDPVWLDMLLKLGLFALYPALLLGTGTLNARERVALWRGLRTLGNRVR